MRGLSPKATGGEKTKAYNEIKFAPYQRPLKKGADPAHAERKDDIL